MDFTIAIKGHELDYIEDEHIYLVDGIIVPSITQMLKAKFGKKYEGVSAGVLARAAEKGTEMHSEIERYCEAGIESESEELRNFKFLMKQYKLEPIANEVPVILFDGDEPIAAGRLDLVLGGPEGIGGGDLKRTSTLDKEYLAYQLNLYRRAYYQSYDVEWKFIVGIHLRESVRKLVRLPINEKVCDEIINLWREKNEYDFDERQADF